MDRESASEHLAETLQHLCRHWESRRGAVAAQGGQTLLRHAFTIALSREAGTQGSSIAREVGNRLGWHVYDHELLERIAQDMGLRTTLLESVDERRQSWLLETVEAFLSAPVQSDWTPLVSESAYSSRTIFSRTRPTPGTTISSSMHRVCPSPRAPK
jgi:hypothetical protein